MAKNTMASKLPRKLEARMEIVGEQIKLARLRRNLSIAQVAERATCSPLTVGRIEKGSPAVALGFICAYCMHCNWTRIYFCSPKKTSLDVGSRI